MWPTRSPSGWRRRALQIGVGPEIAIETSSTRTPRPSARGPCGLLSSVADSASGSRSMWPTRSPSGWRRRELQVGVDLEITIETSSTRTPRPSARGPCGLLSSVADSASGSRSMWPTRSPSGWRRRELQVGVDLEITIETSSTRTPRPSARGPCWLLSSVADSASGSRSVWPTRSPSGWRRRELQVGVGIEITIETSSTRTPRPSARGPCGLLSSVADSASGSRSMWPTRSPSGWRRRELQFGVDLEITIETSSTRTPRPSARGPCGLLSSVADSASGSRSVWPTRSPSGWRRRELQVGVGIEITIETSSTRTPRPSARGPCWLLSSVADSASGSRSVWPTRSPSGWRRRELQVGVDLEITIETSSTRTPRPSARGPCGLLSSVADSASGSRSMWPTRSPSGWRRRELQVGVGIEITIETSSTRTPRPSARGPCGLLSSVAERSSSRWTQGELQLSVGLEAKIETTSTLTPRPSARGPCWLLSSVADSASGSRSVWPTRSPSGWRRRELQVGVGIEITIETSSTRTPRPSARGPCGLLSSVAERSSSRWTQGELQLSVGLEAKIETTSTLTPRPSARGPCWLLWGRLADRDQSSRTVPESMERELRIVIAFPLPPSHLHRLSRGLAEKLHLEFQVGEVKDIAVLQALLVDAFAVDEGAVGGVAVADGENPDVVAG